MKWGINWVNLGVMSLLALNGLVATVTNAHAEAILMSRAQKLQANIMVIPLNKGAITPQTHTINLTGQVVWPAQAQLIIASPVKATVESLLVTPLQFVARGAPIAKLYSSDVLTWQNELLQLSTTRELATQTLKRERQLYKEGIIAFKRVLEAEAALKLIDINMAEKRRLLQFIGANQNSLNPTLTLTAKQAGIISELTAKVGQTLEAVGTVATQVNGQALWVNMQATSTQASQISVGNAVSIKTDSCTVEAKVKQHGLTVNTATQNKTIVAEVPANTCLQPNQFVTAAVRLSQTNSLLAGHTYTAPVSALVKQQGKNYVMVLTDQGFNAVPIVVKGAVGGRVTFSGVSLQPNQHIAITGLLAIKSVWTGFGAEQAPIAGAK